MNMGSNDISAAISPETLRKIKHILDELGAEQPGRRLAAEAELRAMGNEAVLAIGRMLEPDLQHCRSSLRIFRRLVYLLLGVFAGALVVRIIFGVQLFTLCIIPLDVIALSSLVTMIRYARSPPRGLHLALIAIADKESIPLLLDSYELLQIPQKETLLPPLTRILSGLSPDDMRLLPHLHRVRLRSILDQYASDMTRYPPEFIIVIIKAFERARDKSCVPVMKRLAKTRRDRMVKTAARSYLDTLNSLADLPADQLLRAASNPPERELLRAVKTEPATDSSLLLRMVDGNKRESER